MSAGPFDQVVADCTSGLVRAAGYACPNVGPIDDLEVIDRLEVIGAIVEAWQNHHEIHEVGGHVYPTREGVRQYVLDWHKVNGQCDGSCLTVLDDIDREAWALIGAYHRIT